MEEQKRLEGEALQQARYLSLLIAHHQEIIKQLEADLRGLVAESSGTDQPFNLNLESGVISHESQ